MSEAARVAAAPVPDRPGLVWFDDLAEGDVWTSPRRTITEADIVAFAGVSGDFNAIHVDEVHAASTAFGRRLAHGALVLSIATGLRQQLGIFNGSMKALLELRGWKFRRPVFAGDTVAAVTTVLEVKPTSKGDGGVVTQRVDVVNQDGEVVQTGELVSLMSRRPEDAT